MAKLIILIIVNSYFRPLKTKISNIGFVLLFVFCLWLISCSKEEYILYPEIKILSPNENDLFTGGDSLFWSFEVLGDVSSD